MNGERPRIVLVGGGFGGLTTARRLRSLPVDVTLLDRRNFHLFQPLLYQVATGALSPANIAAPLRAILKRSRNTRVLLADVTGFDVARRSVVTTSGAFPYDTLVVAAGVRHQYFGHDEWESEAPGLKTLEDAVEMRRRILLAFERAETETDAAERRALLTFVIVGAGPTGAELAGALGEIARHTLRREFRTIDPAEARVLLVEGGARVLAAYPPGLSAKAESSLASLGVETVLHATVTAVKGGRVTISRAGESATIEARTILWAAGVAASPLAAALAAATGAPTDRAGRIAVGEDLTLPGHPEIFVLGDMAALSDEKGRALPGVAPVAMQQGRYVARAIAGRLAGRATAMPFRYRDRGSMATIGRGRAIAHLGFLTLAGYPAWLAWLFIHLMYLVQFGNRVLILVQWAWNYLTWNRSARLITGLSAASRSSRES
ncbi:MAG TPA: NAD(P)/FAD-dependent oxidoreductase [Thermoanaerobaculia bacterium]|jgi:NADH dehydrogenase